jgi:ATP-binding cassette subfamily B multidrug efflux pump
LIVAVVGWAVWLWAGDAATVGHGGGGDGADAAAQRHDRLDHVGGVVSFFRSLGVVAEGMETITEPVTLTDAPERNRSTSTRGRSGSTACPTITGAARAGWTG